MLRTHVFWACNGISVRFQFLCKLDTEPHVVSKRVILSEIAKCSILWAFWVQSLWLQRSSCKILWQLAIQWDESVPQDIHTRWIAFRTQMSNSNQLKIPRCVKFNVHQPIVEVHGFCDVSQCAFGVCVYLRTKLGLNDHHSKLLKVSCRATQNRFVIRAIGRFTIGALNQG